MRCKNKKNAFTLTELLVVVVIIGTLAVVILPKYNKVMETRKTTEAEEVMAAVRMEQEKRCALDKPYIAGEISKLAQLIPQNSSNFTYTLEETGMAASSQGKYSYNLKMPSYADGRICCDGDECEKLNKDYVKCTDLVVQEDYQVATECAAEPSTPPVVPCTDTPETSAPCETGCGTKTRPITGCKDGKWEYGEWSTCAEKLDDLEEKCVKENGQEGTKVKKASCVNGEWQYGDWSECQAPDRTCSYLLKQNGYKGTSSALNSYCKSNGKVPSGNINAKVTNLEDCCRDSGFVSQTIGLYALDYNVYPGSDVYCPEGNCYKYIVAEGFEHPRAASSGQTVCVTASECYTDVSEDQDCLLSFSHFTKGRELADTSSIKIIRSGDYCATCTGGCKGTLWAREDEIPSNVVFAGGKYYLREMREVPTDKNLDLYDIEDIFPQGDQYCKNKHVGAGDLVGPGSCQSYDWVLQTSTQRTNLNNAVQSAAGFCHGQSVDVGDLVGQTPGGLRVGFQKHCVGGRFEGYCEVENSMFILPRIYKKDIKICVEE